MTGHHLILGGCGFIGRHVAVELARRGYQVVVADRTPAAFRFPPDIASHISWQFLEAASADWDSLVADATVVHHYVWTSLPASANANPLGDLTSNVTTTLGILEALRRRGNGRILFSSSGGTVYGRLKQIPVPESHPLKPITAYGAGKVTAEVYLGLYQALYGMDCRVARIANPFGAGQNLARGQGAVTTFLHHAFTSQPIVIWGDGEVVRDYIHVSDVARAMVALALAPVRNELQIVNIGNGKGVTLNAIISEAERHLGRTLSVTHEQSRPFDVPASVLDISCASDQLGWAPRLCFSEGVARTLADLAVDSPISNMD